MYSKFLKVLFRTCNYNFIGRRFCSTAAATETAQDVAANEVLAPVEPSRNVPIVTSRELQFPPVYQKPRQAWVENLDTLEEKKLGLIDLHPEVFAVSPRIDILQQNAKWQQRYKFVSFAHTKSRAEVRGGGRKPWPQKGMGRARHGSIRSPLWRGGGVAHGPRSPTPYFFMLPFYVRVQGLLSALSVKLAQDDVHVVDSLDIPTDDPQYLEGLIDNRLWGPSVLLIDRSDIMPRNITIATDSLGHVNLMPVYSLNVYSMLKHNTLVLTLAAVDAIEEKLLYHLHRTDHSVTKKFQVSMHGSA